MNKLNLNPPSDGNIINRLFSPTPRFWRKVRTIMATIGTVSGALIITPVSLPSTVITLAGYGVAIGIVGTSLAQLTKK